MSGIISITIITYALYAYTWVVLPYAKPVDLTYMGTISGITSIALFVALAVAVAYTVIKSKRQGTMSTKLKVGVILLTALSLVGVFLIRQGILI